jgi:hypothetical protein
MEDFSRVMKAPSESSRVKIVKVLQRKPMCVCELQKALQIAQSSVSKHPRYLRRPGPFPGVRGTNIPAPVFFHSMGQEVHPTHMFYLP